MIKVIKKGNPRPVVFKLKKHHIIFSPNEEEENVSIKIGKNYFDISYSDDYGTISIYEAKNNKSNFASGKFIKQIKIK